MIEKRFSDHHIVILIFFRKIIMKHENIMISIIYANFASTIKKYQSRRMKVGKNKICLFVPMTFRAFPLSLNSWLSLRA